MSLAAALSDLKADAVRGVNFENAVKAIAKDYGLNPLLLIRKFNESYGTVERARAFTEATDAGSALAAKIEETTKKLSEKYGVPLDRTNIRKGRDGVRYTVIGRLGSKLVLVSHKDGGHYQAKLGFIHT